MVQQQGPLDLPPARFVRFACAGARTSDSPSGAATFVVMNLLGTTGDAVRSAPVVRGGDPRRGSRRPLASAARLMPCLQLVIISTTTTTTTITYLPACIPTCPTTYTINTSKQAHASSQPAKPANQASPPTNKQGNTEECAAIRSRSSSSSSNRW